VCRPGFDDHRTALFIQAIPKALATANFMLIELTDLPLQPDA